MTKRFFLALALFWVSAHAATNLHETAPCDPPHGAPRGTLGVGISLQSLTPSHLPEFSFSVPTYGAVVTVPIGEHAIQAQGAWGGNGGFDLFLVEAAFRYNIPTPYFYVFALGGVHWLRYSPDSGNTYSLTGANTGLGLSFSAGSQLEVALMLKVYLQSELITSYAAEISWYF